MFHIDPKTFLAAYLLIVSASSLEILPLEALRWLIFRLWFPYRPRKRTRMYIAIRVMILLAAPASTAALYWFGLLSQFPQYLLYLAPYDLLICGLQCMISYRACRAHKLLAGQR